MMRVSWSSSSYTYTFLLSYAESVGATATHQESMQRGSADTCGHRISTRGGAPADAFLLS